MPLETGQEGLVVVVVLAVIVLVLLAMVLVAIVLALLVVVLDVALVLDDPRESNLAPETPLLTAGPTEFFI